MNLHVPHDVACGLIFVRVALPAQPPPLPPAEDLAGQRAFAALVFDLMQRLDEHRLEHGIERARDSDVPE